MCNRRSYSRKQIDAMFSMAPEVNSNPYMLYAAYALSCLYDILSTETEDDEECMRHEEIFGQRVSKRLIDRLVIDMAEDFCDAARNYKPVRVFGKNASIRKPNQYNKEKLTEIFRFESDGEDYIITDDGIIDLSDDGCGHTGFERSCSESQSNRTYLRQVIMLAEDDEHDGWDRLTDMEIVMYCWAKFNNDRQSDNFMVFKDEYKDYIYVKEKDIIECLNDKASLKESPVGMYTFSMKKVSEWNKKNRQKSFASQIDPQKADDYWYEKAINSTFKHVV